MSWKFPIHARCRTVAVDDNGQSFRTGPVARTFVYRVPYPGMRTVPGVAIVFRFRFVIIPVELPVHSIITMNTTIRVNVALDTKCYARI